MIASFKSSGKNDSEMCEPVFLLEMSERRAVVIARLPEMQQFRVVSYGVIQKFLNDVSNVHHINQRLASSFQHYYQRRAVLFLQFKQIISSYWNAEMNTTV